MSRPDQDLRITLISPDGTAVPLSTNNGYSTERNYGTGPNDCSGTSTVFDDAATESIIDASNVTSDTESFAGTFHPEGELSDAAGAQLTAGARGMPTPAPSWLG